jgi:hypothetical protein
VLQGIAPVAFVDKVIVSSAPTGTTAESSPAGPPSRRAAYEIFAAAVPARRASWTKTASSLP